MPDILRNVQACVDYIHSMKGREWDEAAYDRFWTLVKDTSEPDYGAFNARLMPEISADRIWGVRRPYLRKMAGQIAKGDYRSYLEVAKKSNKPGINSFEEMSLYGLVIGYEKDYEYAINDVRAFLPLLDNWSINDTFCACLKITKNHSEEMMLFLKECLNSKDAYDIRFAIVMLLTYYINDTYLSSVFEACDQCERGNYYIDMAVAWTISMCYVKYRDETLHYLRNSRLDRFTYNKSIQKIIESNQVTKEEKQYLKTLKRTE